MFRIKENILGKFDMRGSQGIQNSNAVNLFRQTWSSIDTKLENCLTIFCIGMPRFVNGQKELNNEYQAGTSPVLMTVHGTWQHFSEIDEIISVSFCFDKYPNMKFASIHRDKNWAPHLLVFINVMFCNYGEHWKKTLVKMIVPGIFYKIVLIIGLIQSAKWILIIQ